MRGLGSIMTYFADALVDALAGPYEDIPVHSEAKDLDYEVRAWCPMVMIF